ncbi:MAG: F0F1 ATP synthase subunit A [Bacteroidota bacterium]
MILRKLFIFNILLVAFVGSVFADDEGEKKEFNAAETILHHVQNTHDWHLTDYYGTDESGKKVKKSVAIHFPWFFYSSKTGFEFFGSTHAMHEDGRFVAYHEHPKALAAGMSIPEDYHGHGDLPEETFEADHFILDLSPSKAVVHMILVGIALMLIFIPIARAYKKNEGKAPKGMQSFFEPLIMFVRDDIVKTYLPEKAVNKYLPYLLTLFFFIWFSNLFGLMPLSSNIMGNIAVTGALAIMTFIIVQVNGTKDYWTHIFAMPGVPKGMLFLLTPIEIISLFVKPIALMIRLFANISAGHFMILSLICLIFILGKGGESVGGALGIMPISIAFTIAIFCLEMVVAIIQAYIFTLLTSVFLGEAMESHDDHH